MTTAVQPARLLPPTHGTRVRKFGTFDFRPEPRPGNPERIVILGDWVRTHLVEVSIPQLARYGVRSRVTVHYLAAKPLQALWQSWEDEALLHLVSTWDGCWVPRFKRQTGTEAERAEKCKHLGAASLSNHAWATAFDINASLHPLGKKLPTADPFGALFVPARFEGWFPGADFVQRPDPMHFELAG